MKWPLNFWKDDTEIMQSLLNMMHNLFTQFFSGLFPDHIAKIFIYQQGTTVLHFCHQPSPFRTHHSARTTVAVSGYFGNAEPT